MLTVHKVRLLGVDPDLYQPFEGLATGRVSIQSWGRKFKVQSNADYNVASIIISEQSLMTTDTIHPLELMDTKQ